MRPLNSVLPFLGNCWPLLELVVSFKTSLFSEFFRLVVLEELLSGFVRRAGFTVVERYPALQSLAYSPSFAVAHMYVTLAALSSFSPQYVALTTANHTSRVWTGPRLRYASVALVKHFKAL